MSDDTHMSSTPSGTSQFATTHWSVVLAAGSPESSHYQEALETLCRTYWFPVYAYLRRHGHTTHQAEDYVQGFFTYLLEKRGLRRVDPQCGKFRSFLLATLKHFLTVLVGSCESTKKAEPLTEAKSSAEQSVRQEHHLLDEPTSENDQRLRRVFEDRQYVSKDGGRLRYDLMKPKDYDHRKKYPLVLCLHGGGGSTRAARVLAEATLQAKYRCFVLAPEALVGETWGRRSPQIMTDVQPLVLEIIETLKNEFSIDTKRFYITGQSMGGFGTYAFITCNPGMFAAAVPVCGRGDPAEAKYIAKIPIWIFHGDKDALVLVDYSRDMFEALKKAGGNPRYTEYEGLGHNSWDKAYATDELWAWLFAQRKMGK